MERIEDLYHSYRYSEFDYSAFLGNVTNVSQSIPDSPTLATAWLVYDPEYFRHRTTWTVILAILYIIVLVIGFAGNLTVLAVLILRPQMRTVANLFILNLAVADLLVVVFCVPGTLLVNLFAPWMLGWFMCKAVACVQGVSVFASAYSLVAISLYRCKAIYLPLEHSRSLGKRQAIYTILLIWVLAFMMILPWAGNFNVVPSSADGHTLCVETWENPIHGKLYFLVVNCFLCYILPLLVITVSNVTIFCNVRRRSVPPVATSVALQQMYTYTQNGVRKTLIIVTMAFLLSWLPLYVLTIQVKFFPVAKEKESNVFAVLIPLAHWLGSLNSSFNPLLYAFLNRKFRLMVQSLLPPISRPLLLRLDRLFKRPLVVQCTPAMPTVENRQLKTHHAKNLCRDARFVQHSNTRGTRVQTLTPINTQATVETMKLSENDGILKTIAVIRLRPELQRAKIITRL